jgi:predicted AAA+ superfamily ATPase
MEFERKIVAQITARLLEPRRFIQVVTGPRQTGKTTAITQALVHVGLPYRFVSVDRQASMSLEWLEAEWRIARSLIDNEHPSAVLVLDEIQNIPQWSGTVKALWDEDARSKLDLRILVSGSSSLLLQKGLSESLMGRFEVVRCTHWNLREMRDAFGYGLDDFLLLGGYPAAATLKNDPERWLHYMSDSIIEATISRDVLHMEEVRKPALLRNLFILGCQYSAQEISYRNLQGQLSDKGNVATIAHYLDLLGNAGLLGALMKFNNKELETRRSSPRLMVFDTSLMTSASRSQAGLLLTEPERRGHLCESAVGAYLLARSKIEMFDMYWWREGNHEVDFVLKHGMELIALEVKSGRNRRADGLVEFLRCYPHAQPMIVGDESTPIESFLLGKVPLF